MKTQIFSTTSGVRLIFAADAWRSVHRYRQKGGAVPEAGGALLGRHLLDSEDVVVDSITTPQPTNRPTLAYAIFPVPAARGPRGSCVEGLSRYARLSGALAHSPGACPLAIMD